jgi:hypothetical protein
MVSVFALSRDHGLERVQYGCERIYMDKQHLHGVVSLHALQQVPGAAPAPCVLKVLGFHAQLCFDLTGTTRINGAGLAGLQEYVDAGLHRSYEAV